MSWSHERVEELLASFALGGLNAEDSSLAERALIEHVPGCPSCRGALDDFREVGGELALGAPTVRPPDTLLASLRRSMAMGPPRRWTGWATAGAAVLLFGVLAGWTVVLADRLSDTETRHSGMVEALSALGHPEAGSVQLSGSAEGRIRLLYVRGEGRVFLLASGMPAPDQGLYRVWLLGRDSVLDAGSFVPERGVAVMQVDHDVDAFDHVLVTHEPNGDSPTPAAPPIAKATVLTTPPSPSPSPTRSPSPAPTPTQASRR